MAEARRNGAEPANRSESQESFRKLASADELKGRKKNGNEPGRSGNRRLLLTAGVVLLALALSVGAYLLSLEQTLPTEENSPEPVKTETVKLIDRAREDVAEVTVETGGESYTVVNGTGNAQLTMKGRPWFDLDQEKAGLLISCASRLTASRTVAENTEDLASYGLDAPKARVTMSYLDGTETVWLVGAYAPTSTGSYFMEENTKAVYLLYASAIEGMSRARAEMHRLNMPGKIDADLIRNLTVEAEGRDAVEIGYSEEESDKSYSISALRIRQPFYYTANAERATELFNGLAALTIASYAGETGELADSGLENGGFRYRVTVCQARSAEDESETETFVYRIGGFTEDGKSVYMSVDKTEAVYLADAASAAFLENATAAYLVDSFSNLIYINAVRGIEINARNDRWELGIEHGENGKTSDVFRCNGIPVKDDQAFRKLYQQIIGTTHSKISPDYHLDGEVLLSVRYLLETDPGEVLVEYLAYDEDYCAVRRDGLTLFLIKREQVDALEESLQKFEEEITFGDLLPEIDFVRTTEGNS